MHPERLREETDTLAQRLAERARFHPGRLTALRMSVPPEVDPTDFEKLFELALAEAGLDFVDVHVLVSPGPCRTVEARFEPD